MMSHQLDVILNRAIKKANDLNHEYITLEGVLWSLLSEKGVIDVIRDCGVEEEELVYDLEDFFTDASNFSILNEEEIEELNKIHFSDENLRKMAFESGIRYQPEISLALQRVIQRAAIQVHSSNKKEIRAIHLLVALFQEKESFAVYLLEKHGIKKLDVIKRVAHGKDKAENLGEESQEEVSEQDEDIIEEVPQKPLRKKSALSEFTVNLNELAKGEKIDPIIGREEEITRIVQILCRRRKNNPILVGEAGVGKTAIAEGLAIKIIQGEVPAVLKGATVYSLDMGALLAGAKFRGDFEERVKAVIKEIAHKKDKGEESILFIDEIHTVMGAGSTAGGSMDASNLLKPALSNGKLRCMGSTTFDEYRKFVEKDHAFNRRFQKIDIQEPSIDETFKILQGLRPRFEKHHGVKYSNNVLKSAVDLSNRYLSDRKLPDKAIDVIDEAGAVVQLMPPSKKKTNISIKDIENIISVLARVPVQSVTGTEKEKLKGLEKSLKLLIYGQDHAVNKVCDAILMARSGLGDTNRPTGSFLFTGPTGVGKTELSKQLASHLGVHFERFDMSEFMEKHSVAKFIGAPPGYVGHDQGGTLTEAVNKNPHSVILLDEIEKAHPDIFNLLLQVMDHGSLTDSQGRTSNFKNVILIMTTNAGAQDMESGSIGLGNTSGSNSVKRDKAIKNFFSPEFRNRLDGIIHFNSLSMPQIHQIVEKFLSDLEMVLAEKNVQLDYDDLIVDWIGEKAYDPKMGARPIARFIDTEIKRKLSHEILFGSLEKGGIVELLVENNTLEFKFGPKIKN
ncbi:MAG: ATP-dependent Clp protease ATP-binding subunit ClpA [Bacteriovoracaceae bacterium]